MDGGGTVVIHPETALTTQAPIRLLAEPHPNIRMSTTSQRVSTGIFTLAWLHGYMVTWVRGYVGRGYTVMECEQKRGSYASRADARAA